MSCAALNKEKLITTTSVAEFKLGDEKGEIMDTSFCDQILKVTVTAAVIKNSYHKVEMSFTEVTMYRGIIR